MKQHSPINPATPLPYTSKWIAEVDKHIAKYDGLEIDNIMQAKKVLYDALFDFNLTTKKLGRNMVQGYFVSGGCIASLLQGEDPKDFDIWFHSKFVADPIINLYTNDGSYKNDVKDVNEKYRDSVGVDGKMITENAVTLKNDLQLITKNYGTPDEIRKTFDFVHCMPYYIPSEDKLYISREQYDCCVNRILKVNNKDSVKSHREHKFYERNYRYGDDKTLNSI